MRSDKVNSSKRTIIRSDPYFIGSALNFNVASATYSPLKNEKGFVGIDFFCSNNKKVDIFQLVLSVTTKNKLEDVTTILTEVE